MKFSFGAITLCYVCALVSFGNAVTNNKYRIPIGAIFPKNDQVLQTAFKYGIWKQEANRTSSGFESEVIVEELNQSDPATVGRSVCHLLKRGIFTLVASSTSRIDYASLVSYTNRIQMPTVFPVRPDTEDTIIPEAKLEVNLKPSTWKAAADFIRSRRWTEIIYLSAFQKDGHDRYQSFLKLVKTVTRLEGKEFAKIQNGAEATMILRRLEVTNRDTPKQVVLDMDYKMAFEVLRYHARDIYISKNNFEFLILEPTMKSFWNREMDTVRGVRTIGFVLVDDESDPEVTEFIKSWNSLRPNEWPSSGPNSFSLEVALAYDASHVVLEAYRRLLTVEPDFFARMTRRGDRYVPGSRGIDCFQSPMARWEHGEKVAKYIRETYAPDGLTGPIQFDSHGRRKGYNLEIFFLGDSGATHVGDWSDTTGLHITQNLEALDRQTRVAQDRPLIITTIRDIPYLMLKSSHGNSSGTQYEGFCVDLVDLLAKKMGFAYKIKIVDDGKYGTYNEETNSWTGMIGEVVNGVADMAVAPLTITSKRRNAVDFSSPFLSVGISMMAKKPGSEYIGLESSFLFFFSAFTKEVWICLLAVYIIMSVLFFLVVRFSGPPDRVAEQKSDDRIGICDSFWFGCGSTLFRSIGIYPRSIASRILSTVWWFFTLAAVALYSANMATLLITEHMSPMAMINGKQFTELSFSSVMEQAVQTKEIKIGPVKGGSTAAFFKNSVVPLHRRFWEYLSENEDMYSNTNAEGVERVRDSNGNYIFLIESMSNAYANSHPPCDTLEIKGTFWSRGYGIAFKKGSPLRDEVNQALLELEESGELYNIYDKWWKPSCQKESRRKVSELYHGSLTLSEMSGLFYILMIGVVIAATVTAFELCYRKHHGNQQYSG